MFLMTIFKYFKISFVPYDDSINLIGLIKVMKLFIFHLSTFIPILPVPEWERTNREIQVILIAKVWGFLRENFRNTFAKFHIFKGRDFFP